MDGWVNRGQRRRFSPRELRHLAASIVALTAAFLMIMTVDPGEVLADPTDLAVQELLSPGNVLTAVTVVVTGFLFHELAHKFVAQWYGHWSEFRASYGHLVLAVLISLFGFLFAAPGAVNIVGNVSDDENGVISAVGPLTNMILAGGFLWLWQGSINVAPWEGIFFHAAFFNIVLAGFNMLPVRPLDGSKVVRWNLGVYVVFLLILALELKVLFPELPIPP